MTTAVDDWEREVMKYYEMDDEDLECITLMLIKNLDTEEDKHQLARLVGHIGFLRGTVTGLKMQIEFGKGNKCQQT